ncbi:MAG: DUF4912 domain-containing protein [Candidatus Ornithospirochaeta sp.]|nr:DUF4912 domain-containing protein [Candidatus Ornithospirochaeta sp.]
MILIKIESLSTSELKAIAADEKIPGYESLSREELISELTQIYEDEDIDYSFDNAAEPNLRYLSGLTDYRAISDQVSELPGVEELPMAYPEMSMHLLFRNSSWGYCYWSLSPLENERLIMEGYELSLFVVLEGRDGRHEEYEIPVSYSDSEWNIGFSQDSQYCQVHLIASKGNEKEELASSKKIELPSSYWLSHRGEMRSSEDLYKLYLTLITNREGDLVENQITKEIVEAFQEEDAR